MNVGCHFAGIVVNLLAYADDMVIIAPSWQAWQTLLLAVEDDACKINGVCECVCVCSIHTIDMK